MRLRHHTGTAPAPGALTEQEFAFVVQVTTKALREFWAEQIDDAMTLALLNVEQKGDPGSG